MNTIKESQGNKTKSITRRIVVVLLGAACLVTVTGGRASAATYDGQDPTASGCANSASTVRSAPLTNGKSTAGMIELRYSSQCRTVWARITGASPRTRDQAGGYAAVTRNSDGRRYACVVSSGSTCYTAMVNDSGVTSFASGSNDPGWAVYTGRTTSY